MNVVYIVGAGLSKALERSGFRVPMMNDFVSVSADYMERDVARIIFTSLRALEPCFQWPILAPEQNASGAAIQSYANALRRRPAENIEDLLAAASGSKRTLATRVRYLINRLFVLLDWNVDDLPLRRLLGKQFSRPTTRHTLISFNYDLFLDRVVQETLPSWSVATGYGFPAAGYVLSDPEPGPPGPDVLSFTGSKTTCPVVILKPHGSLNWLVPLAERLPMGDAGLLFADEPPIIPLREDGGLRYCAATSDFQYVYPQSGHPIDVLPAIVPPVQKKDFGLGFLRNLLEMERRAVADADEIFIIGWSMPKTDANQITLIRDAIARRTKKRRLTVINRGAAPEYFTRVAEVFAVQRSGLRVFNSGFDDFVHAELNSSPHALMGCAAATLAAVAALLMRLASSLRPN